MNKIKRIDLINNEGPNLSLQRDPTGKLVIVDQWGEEVWSPTLEEFSKWLQGKIEILDSKSQSWNYLFWSGSNFIGSATELNHIIQFLIDTSLPNKPRRSEDFP
jgi:hypothetical protein